MAFQKPLPEWHAQGVQIPEQIKNQGWGAGVKPPAEYFNHLQHRTYEALKELQEKAVDDEKLTDAIDPLATQLDNVVGTVLTPAMFGAVGDGVLPINTIGHFNANPTDDYEALQACFNAIKNEEFYTLDLQGKTYITSRELELPSMWEKRFVNGVIKAKATNFVGEYVIRCIAAEDEDLRPQSSGHDLEDMRFEKITIDGSFVANGLYLREHIRIIFDEFKVHRYKKYGFYNNGDGHEINMFNSYFRYSFKGEVNDMTEASGVTAIYTRCHDSYYDNITIVGGYAGIVSNGKYNYWTNIHAYSCEYGAIVKAAANNFDGCYWDCCKVRIENPWMFSMTNSRFLQGWQLAEVYPSITEYGFIELVNTGSTAITMRGINIDNVQLELYTQISSAVIAKVFKFIGTFNSSTRYSGMHIGKIAHTGNVVNNLKTNYFSDTLNAEKISVSNQNPFSNAMEGPRQTYVEMDFNINPETDLPYATSGRSDGARFLFDTRFNWQNNNPIGFKIQLSDSLGNTPLPLEDKFLFYKAGQFQPLGGYKSVDGSNGLTTSFTTHDGKTVTVKNGLITMIV